MRQLYNMHCRAWVCFRRKLLIILTCLDYLFFLITGLQQYVGGNNVTINKENADAFEDGKIDVMDVAVLMKKNAGYDIKFSHKCGNYMFVPGRIDDQNHGTDYE